MLVGGIYVAFGRELNNELTPYLCKLYCDRLVGTINRYYTALQLLRIFYAYIWNINNHMLCSTKDFCSKVIQT